MSVAYKTGLVSIIMPAYNSQKTILESISSVLAQSYQEWELIICDDASQDNTKHRVACYLQEQNVPRVKLIDNHNPKGAAGARNSAIEAAKGQYIAFLDADDLWLSDKLLKQVSFMKKSKCAFSYGDYLIFDKNTELPSGEFITPNSIDFPRLCKTCDIGCLTVMLDRHQIDDVMMEYIEKEDYATWVRILKNNALIAEKYSGILALYRLSQSSLSANKKKEIKKQYNVLRKVAKLSVVKSVISVTFYILKGIQKHYVYYRKP